MLKKRLNLKSTYFFNCQNLLDCWFAGFFLGDGSIESKTKKGRLNLAVKDIHLFYFIANYLKLESHRVKLYPKSCRLNFSKALMVNLMETFKISINKSYGEVVFPDFLRSFLF